MAILLSIQVTKNFYKLSTMEYETEQYFRLNIAKGREFMINSEYYGYSVKMNGKTYKYNHNFKTIKKWRHYKYTYISL